MDEPRILPTGMVTFLFTDIEGSTPLMQRFPQAMPRALARHHAILQDAIRAHDGWVFNIIGDAFCAAFANASDAARAALAAQRGLREEAWGETGALRVRMGIYAGEAETRGDDYISNLTLVRVQRLMSAGNGGQILLSTTAADAVRADLAHGVVLRDLGMYRLRGLAQPERIWQLSATDLPVEFAPVRAQSALEFEQEPVSLLDKLVRGKIVGRAPEIEQLHRRWHSALQGSAQLVLISGEPGVGKTRLAQEALALARTDRAVIWRGGCYEYEAATPYLPFVEALRDWVHAQTPAQLANALGDTAPEIAKLAPEIESKLAGITLNASARKTARHGQCSAAQMANMAWGVCTRRKPPR
jgi:class 3 adenylate cyclase